MIKNSLLFVFIAIPSFATALDEVLFLNKNFAQIQELNTEKYHNTRIPNIYQTLIDEEFFHNVEYNSNAPGLLQKILAKGGRVNSYRFYVERTQAERGKYALGRVEYPLHEAIRVHTVTGVKFLLDHGATASPEKPSFEGIPFSDNDFVYQQPIGYLLAPYPLGDLMDEITYWSNRKKDIKDILILLLKAGAQPNPLVPMVSGEQKTLVECFNKTLNKAQYDTLKKSKQLLFVIDIIEVLNQYSSEYDALAKKSSLLKPKVKKQYSKFSNQKYYKDLCEKAGDCASGALFAGWLGFQFIKAGCYKLIGKEYHAPFTLTD